MRAPDWHRAVQSCSVGRHGHADSAGCEVSTTTASVATSRVFMMQ
jgi:hypothetical protein